MIHPDVTQIDAWLIAKKTIYTCYDDAAGISENNGADKLTDGICNKALKINGPVMAGTLKMWRTSGAWGQTNQEMANAAEIFNLRPDAYLWAYNMAKSNNPNSLLVTHVREMPPRF
jgi:hypothetical protein